MDFNVFKKELLKRALEKGFEQAEVFYQSSENSVVNIYKGSVEKTGSNFSGGFGFRGIYDNMPGYYYSEVYSLDIIDEVLDNAIENSKIINTEDKEIIYEGDKEYPTVNVYNPELENISVDEKINACLAMEKAVLDYDSRIKAVNTCQIAMGHSKISIANTKGLNVEEKSNYLVAYVDAVAKENDVTKENGEIFIGRSFEELNPVEIGRKAAKKVIDSLNAKSVKSGKYSVVMKNQCFADLIGCYTGNFYGENVQKGFSLLAGKLNEKIAADIVTLVDEPLLEGGYSTTAFDSEGVAAYNKAVIDKGVLKTFLHNLKSAAKDGVKSTGNGFKSSFKGTVGISETNFYIKNGETDFEKLLENMGDGLLITEISGLHAGTNSISGDFSLLAEGFWVNNGKIVRPVEQITVAGNFYDVLKNIIEIGSDLEFNSSAVGSPSVRIRELSIAGEE